MNNYKLKLHSTYKTNMRLASYYIKKNISFIICKFLKSTQQRKLSGGSGKWFPTATTCDRRAVLGEAQN